jgi:transcriptional regulator with XRE-family HTH domain
VSEGTDRKPPTLGEIIRQQRELAALPMRQLAAMAGISNPYLSQIERGLRAPSEQVLDAIAENLQTSADALQERAKSRSPKEPAPPVVAAIDADPDLTTKQRAALVEAYTAMTEVTVSRRRRGARKENALPPEDR